MAASKQLNIPYPPRPDDVPEGLTDFPESFRKQQNLLLAGLIVFLTFYIGALLLFAMVGIWCIWSFSHWPVLKVIGIVFCSLGFLFLVKGFFKRHPMDKEMHIEVKEDEQPALFEFIRRLCDEVDAQEPNKVFVAPDVNAMCIYRTNLFNLFLEPRKDLLIGLGLVNAVNLSEFKAILAHELGHFSHMGNTTNYVHIVQRIIIDMIRGEDWFDRTVDGLKSVDALKWLGYLIGGPLWLGRTLLIFALRIIAFRDMAVSREQEFHADLVAVSAAGSNAATHGLLRARFGLQCFFQALRDLIPAMDHKLFTNDLYLHQDRAAVVVRRMKKEPQLGLPPVIVSPVDGKEVRVFDAEQDELEDQDETPPMWRSHPTDADREENAKHQFIAAVLDHRSPWLLFSDIAALKERMTYRYLRHEFEIPKNVDLTDARKVQEFIDNEHSETTYDPKYFGAYDTRTLEPGDIEELNTQIADSPWTEERMEKVFAKLYDGCEEHAEVRNDLHKELESLHESVVGRPSKRVRDMIEEAETKLEENREWFKSFDRRVYLLHAQMAAQVDPVLKQQLIERYHFQLEVQRLFTESREAFSKADMYLTVFIAAQQGQIPVGPDFGLEVVQVLRKSWRKLKDMIRDARQINLPAMKNFEEGKRLADFILQGKMVPEPPLSLPSGAWVNKLMTQLQGVRMRCFRLHFKSLGGILALQEQIAAKWQALREPVAAEVVEMEAIEAEVIPAAVVPAEPVPVEAIEAEVIPAVVIEAEAIPAEVIPADVVPASVVPAD